MTREDWVPKSQTKFYALTEKTFAGLLPNKEKYGFGSATDNGKWLVDDVMPPYADLTESFRVWKDKDTRTNLARINLVKDREVFEPLYRRLARILKESISVSDSQLEAMGIPPRRSGGNTPTPKADEEPELEWEIIGKGRIRVYFFRKGGKRHSAKLKGQHGVEFWWVILPEHRAVFIDELTHSEFDTRSPYTFEFSDRLSGQYLYFAARWENTRSEKGPWSEIIAVMIP